MPESRYYFSFSMKKSLGELIEKVMKAEIFESKSEFFRYCLARYGSEVLKLGENFEVFKPKELRILL